MTRPAKSDVYVMDVAPMAASAEELDAIITTALECSHNVHQTIHRFDWDGAAHDAALIRADRQVEEDHAMLSAMGDLRDAEREGAASMGPMISRLRTDGQALEADDFTVAEDWTVTDAWPYDMMFPVARVIGPDAVAALTAKQTERANDAKTATARLQPLADELGEADRKTGARISKATEALNLSIGRAPTTPGDGKKNGPTIQLVDDKKPVDGDQPPADGDPAKAVEPPPNPTVNADGSTPVREAQSDQPGNDDLGAQIVNDPTFRLGGDGNGHLPHLNDKENPLNNSVPKGTRPIVTGTAKGPNGEPLGFFATPKLPEPGGPPNESYVTPNTTVVDLNNPSKILGTLPIAQASAVYDPASNTMFVVGNPGAGTDSNRQIWQSVPIDHNNPNAWINSPLTNRGDVLIGNRESQIVPLQGGGYMLVGATAGGDITATAASTPLGLVGQLNGTSVVTNGPGGVQDVYGPTVLSDQFNAQTGTHTITLRTSQYAPPGSPPSVYDPATFVSSYTVSTPPPPPPPVPPVTPPQQ